MLISNIPSLPPSQPTFTTHTGHRPQTQYIHPHFTSITSTILICPAAMISAMSNSAWSVLKSLSLAYAAMRIIVICTTIFSLFIITTLIVTLQFFARPSRRNVINLTSLQYIKRKNTKLTDNFNDNLKHKLSIK
ncbi:hypothetical protein BC938DRAFT_481324 [Jimgerdemannia flammicorona]|uniref:Uncharacterized protein n=1 Tax=Jimgerdemannia flammicorona TaxID=994334 RepID=A0A433QX35_9FUNG|nr:hypothetical protein BC938DRAFT_481324 [Jimgerdemannia flammicorona]